MDSVINRLWLHAAVMSRCSRSWMALCEPQPGHFIFVTYQNGHFGNSGLAVGSIKKGDYIRQYPKFRGTLYFLTKLYNFIN